jgi:hypothetical protein
MRWIGVAVIAGLLVSGCARDLHLRMVHDPVQHDTGTVTVVLTQPARDLVVAVNGVLVAHRAYTREVRVDGVPAGLAEVAIAAGSGGDRVDLHTRVVVHPGRSTAIPVAAPERSLSSAVYRGVLGVVTWLIGRGVVSLLL